MKYDKYKSFIQNEIWNGHIPKFGFYEDIDKFDILSVTFLYDIDEPNKDIIKFECNYNNDGKKLNRTIQRWKKDYENYLIQNRENKLNELLS
jgi:hypothetical protein